MSANLSDQGSYQDEIQDDGSPYEDEDGSSFDGNHQNEAVNIQLPKISKSLPDKAQTKAVVPKKAKNVIPDPTLPPIAVNYPKCTKGGFHEGQLLNMACLDLKCLQNSAVCAVCLQEQHKTHKVRPLKILIQLARRNVNSTSSLNIDVESIKLIVVSSQSQLMKKYDQFGKQVQETMGNIKSSIKLAHLKMSQQVDFKMNNKEMVNEINQLDKDGFTAERLNVLVNSLLVGAPSEQEADYQEQTNEDQIQMAVTAISSKLDKEFVKKTDVVKTDLLKYLQILQKTSEDYNIFNPKTEYKFSTTLKHQGVEIIEPNKAKSTEGYNYHFALMEPSLEESNNSSQKVIFKISENVSNWVAVGICYRKTVEDSSFNFNCASIGHGAYMISSNGGSWCSSDASFNNVVTAFHFSKGDHITVHYDPANSKVNFHRNETGQEYSINFLSKPGDELHLCALFYYKEDEIEFLGNEGEASE